MKLSSQFIVFILGWVAVACFAVKSVQSGFLSSWAAAFWETTYLISGSILLARSE